LIRSFRDGGTERVAIGGRRDINQGVRKKRLKKEKVEFFGAVMVPVKIGSRVGGRSHRKSSRGTILVISVTDSREGKNPSRFH